MIALDYKDFTIKSRIKNLIEIERLLYELQAHHVGTDHQHDTYFKVERGKLKWRQGTIENLITHYERVIENGLEQTIVYRYDLHPGEQQINELFSNYSVLGEVRKKRKIFFIDNIKIHLDLTKSGERFIEIEAIDRHNSFSTDDLRKHCLRIKDVLGIKNEELIKTGYF